jgi:two-component system OmpR family response regulator
MQKKKIVLVIDDDEIHLYTAQELLQSEQVEIITHQGSFGVTNLVNKIKPDLLLLDINMPALSGSSLAEILLPYCNEIKTPIVFYSSNDEDAMKDIVAEKGVHGYICKGDPDALRTKVYGFLNLK